uniref:PEST proteolytic signal-containing nuclear protein n=1 Tax=Macrostomum lignano TaxID=282301 RepID=A0A1I8I8J2_9PLAT
MWNPSAVPAAATFGSTAGVSAQQSPGQAAAASIAVSTPSFSHYAALAAAYSSAAAAVPVVPAPVQAPKRPSDLKNVNTSTMCRFNLGNGAPTGPLPEAHSNAGDDDESAFEAEFDRIMEAKRQAEEANLDPDERAALRELEAVKKQRRFANHADSTEADAAREFDRFQTSSASDSTGDGSELAKQAAEWRTYMSYALQYNPQEAERLFAMYPHLRDLLATPDDAFKQQQTALAVEQTKQPMAPNLNVTSYEIQQQQQQPMQPPIQPQQQLQQQQHLPTLPTMAEAESRRKAQEAAEQALIELAAMQEQQQEQQKQQQQQLEQQQQKQLKQQQQKQLLKQQQKQQREQQAQLKASSKKSSGFHDVSQPP